VWSGWVPSLALLDRQDPRWTMRFEISIRKSPDPSSKKGPLPLAPSGTDDSHDARDVQNHGKKTEFSRFPSTATARSLEKAAERFGYNAILGSTTRRGFSALIKW